MAVQHLKRGTSDVSRREEDAKVRATVEAILADIEARGDAAVRDCSERFDHYTRESYRDGTFSREDFVYDRREDAYRCPAGKSLRQYRRPFGTARSGVDEEGMMRYRASKADCDACALKPRCTPKEPGRTIMRSIHEGARDLARGITRTEAYAGSLRQRKKVEMLFAQELGISSVVDVHAGEELSEGIVAKVQHVASSHAGKVFEEPHLDRTELTNFWHGPILAPCNRDGSNIERRGRTTSSGVSGK